MPEQSLLTSVVGDYCPICTMPKNQLQDQSQQWVLRVPPTRLSMNQPVDDHEPSLHLIVLFAKCLWSQFNSYSLIRLDVLHQLHIGLLKCYIIVWIIKLLHTLPRNCQPPHINGKLVDALDQRISHIPQFHSFQSVPEGCFSKLS